MPPERPSLYAPDLLEHARHPRGTDPLPASPHLRAVELDNPLCGDRVRLQVDTSNADDLQLAHATRGCALCIASASIMIEQLEGLGVAEAAGMADRLSRALELSDGSLPSELDPRFAGLERAPMRRGCVQLPWAALSKAISRRSSVLPERQRFDVQVEVSSDLRVAARKVRGPND